jgi:4-hydroxybenzoate polyprenyltransferase
LKTTQGAILASHAGPTATVTTISYLLASSLLPTLTALGIAATVLSGQLVVGWSNDLLDLYQDKRANRADKPLVSGLITSAVLYRYLWIDLMVVTVFSLLGPMGIKGGVLHLLAVGSGVSYNLYFKGTKFSWLPYALSFGALPAVIVLADNRTPPRWIVASGMMLGIAAHFGNVVKDIESDKLLGIKGLPQIMGDRASRIVAVLALLIASGLMAHQLHGPIIWLACLIASFIVIFGPKIFVFPVLMLLALTDVILLLQTIKRQ